MKMLHDVQPQMDTHCCVLIISQSTIERKHNVHFYIYDVSNGHKCLYRIDINIPESSGVPTSKLRKKNEIPVLINSNT